MFHKFKKKKKKGEHMEGRGRIRQEKRRGVSKENGIWRRSRKNNIGLQSRMKRSRKRRMRRGRNE
jgi:hypothetical protein